MALRKEGLDKEIMLCAKHEFMKYGYKDASTNRIAQQAGVTSGAIYVRYKNKDEIFCSLVQPVIQGIEDRLEFYKGRYSQLGRNRAWDEISELDKEIFDWLTDYMFEYYEEFNLLICKAEGSSASGFASRFIDFKFQKINEFIETVIAPMVRKKDKNAPLPIVKEELALLASAQYHNLFEIIRQGYEKKDAKKYLSTVRQIYENGIRTLLGEFLDGGV